LCIHNRYNTIIKNDVNKNLDEKNKKKYAIKTMKKFVLPFIIVLFFFQQQLSAIETSAIPPDGKRVLFRAGLGYTFRELKKDGGGENDYRSLQMLFTGGFNPFDHLSIFGKVGYSDLQFRGSKRTPLSFTAGGGITVSLLHPSETNNVLIDAQMDYSAPEDYRVINYQFGATYIYRTKNVIPYGGVKFSETSVTNTTTDDSWQGKLKFGILIGIEYFVNPNVFFSAEMHNFDQDAIYGSVGFIL